MSAIFEDLSVVVRAAFNDTVRNVFRPIHNVKVVLGLEEEPSVAEKIGKAEREVRAKEATSQKARAGTA